ncbi:MAG TPA: aminodeoxychorismate synthase component I [Rhizomicrobium sp.]
MSAPTILFDLPQSDRLLRFAGANAIIEAHEPAAVEAALAALEAVRAQGKYAAGYFSYELGYVLEPRLAPLLPQTRSVPLLWFAVFDACEEIAAGDLALEGRAYAGPLRHEWSREAYRPRFDRTHRYIAEGDIYQANLSFRSRFRFAGDPLALWMRLREQAAVSHGAFVDDGTRHVLSLSPELFFEISPNGMLRAKPMKGTASRGREPSTDAAARAHLAMSTKDRAENLMIVDLLRNDVGRIAQTGSVAVENLFAVETYPTLHTMVSTITAQLKQQATIPQIIHALFPCGSITGAPKIRAMQIIRELEGSPRGIYCGAIGHFAPDGSASFNVAIRTLTLHGQDGELGIGGGLVWDSRADSEYDECLLKARYYEAARKPIELIETLRHEPGKGFTHLELHLSRMQTSAETFAIPFDWAAALGALETAVASTDDMRRVRLTVNEAGEFTCTTAPLDEGAASWTYAISPHRVNSADILLRHKTNWREMYEEEHTRFARERNCDEVIFLNERGELAEGSRTNIFMCLEGKLFTPPQSAGLLNGCLRQELLASGACEERVLFPTDLKNAELFLGNSLRGLIPAHATRFT